MVTKPDVGSGKSARAKKTSNPLRYGIVNLC
jgi:hypothetical protein